MRIFRFILASLLFLFASTSHAWWNKDWKQRDKVELNTSAQGVETRESLNGLTLAVRLHMGNFSFSDAKPDGSDLRFVAADDKTVLKHVVERFDAANGIAVIWVQVPLLAAGNATQALWLYHDNPNAPAADAAGVFDSGSVVFNFSEVDGIPLDAGPSGVTATGKPAGIEQAGLLGASAVFKGDPLVLADNAALRHAAASGFSFSLWLKPSAAVNKATLFQQANLELGIDDSVIVLRLGGVVVARGGAVKPEVWQHVGVATGNGRAALYLDGAEVGAGQFALPELAGEVRIGEGLVGVADAVQISAATRSADWFKVVARSQGADPGFPTITPEADSEGGGEHNYFGILIGNLTTDAWVVIGILGVMFAIAVVVMIGKARFISRLDAANRGFLKTFRDANDDFMGLGADAAFDHSSLHRLYLAGQRELRKRTDSADAVARPAALSGASINAIKAAIDADMVRESHRLNDHMVYLTIAIAGGPFLGLLGTVVGVMITFAAIAAAGDVNVNAIAPGIASALLATVAGLAVAIPALFGYNYLASRIKNISADMQIFVDEFVTRLAEQFAA